MIALSSANPGHSSVRRRLYFGMQAIGVLIALLLFALTEVAVEASFRDPGVAADTSWLASP